MINIIKLPLTRNISLMPNRDIRYIVVHYTAGTTSKKGAARNSRNWFNKPDTRASADYIVDDEEIVQCNPDIRNYFCWAVGGRKYPRTYGGIFYGKAKSSNTINIEICSSNRAGKTTSVNDENYYFTEKVVKNTEELVKYLMKEYSITLDRIIRHYDVNGKPCPGVSGWNDGWEGAKASSGDWKAFKERLLQEKDEKIVKVSYNGKKYELQGMMIEGRNYVQIRELLEKVFEKAVEWNPHTQEVIILSANDDLKSVQ